MDKIEISLTNNVTSSENTNCEKINELFSKPPIEWESKTLIFYLVQTSPHIYVIRVPDGSYLELQWATKCSVSEKIYQDLVKITNNFQENYKEAEELVFSQKDSYKNIPIKNRKNILLPISTGVIFKENLFDRFDDITSMVSPNYLYRSVKNSIYKDLFGGNPPDVFLGKSGLWSKSQPPISKDGINMTGRFNKNGVLIL